MSKNASITGREWLRRIGHQRPDIPSVIRHAFLHEGLAVTPPAATTSTETTRCPSQIYDDDNSSYNVASVANVDRDYLDQPLLRDQMDRLHSIEARLMTPEPVQYIEGAAEFYRRMFTVGPGALIPREATDTIIDSVLALTPARQQPYRILDLGTGSGCILATLLLELPHSTGTGVDISTDALALAQTNISDHGLTSRCQLVQSDWTSALQAGYTYDIIVSNPPYIPSCDLRYLHKGVVEYEPRLALEGGDDGLTAYRTIAAQLARVVHSGALITVEIGVSSREFAACRQSAEQDRTAGSSGSPWLNAKTTRSHQESTKCQGDFAVQVRDIFTENGCHLLRVQRDLDDIERALSFRYHPTT